MDCNYQRVSVRIPLELYEEFDQYAVRVKRSKSKLLRKWLQEANYKKIPIKSDLNTEKINYSLRLENTEVDAFDTDINRSDVIRSILAAKLRLQQPPEETDNETDRLWELGDHAGLISSLSEKIYRENATEREVLQFMISLIETCKFREAEDLTAKLKSEGNTSYKVYKLSLATRNHRLTEAPNYELNFDEYFSLPKLAKDYYDFLYAEWLIMSDKVAESKVRILDLLSRQLDINIKARAEVLLGLILIAENDLIGLEAKFATWDEDPNFMANIFVACHRIKFDALQNYAKGNFSLATNLSLSGLNFMQKTNMVYEYNSFLVQLTPYWLITNNSSMLHRSLHLLQQSNSPRSQMWQNLVLTAHGLKPRRLSSMPECEFALHEYVNSAQAFIFSKDTAEKTSSELVLKRLREHAPYQLIQQAALNTLNSKSLQLVY